MTPAEKRALEALRKYGPMFNGSLASHANVVWNSRIFSRMEKAGLIVAEYSHFPYKITSKGLATLESQAHG